MTIQGDRLGQWNRKKYSKSKCNTHLQKKVVLVLCMDIREYLTVLKIGKHSKCGMYRIVFMNC